MDNVMLGFALGPAEICLILFVMLFAFGPKRIPELGKSLGEGLKSFREATEEAESAEGSPS